METVVITGGDGFIGSHLVRYFAEKNLRVYALTIPENPVVKRIQNIRNVTVIQRNLNETDILVKELPKSPLAFIHLAWSGVSPESRSSVDIQLGNVSLCLEAAKLAAKLKAQRFILPGSTMEYAYCGQEINEKACPSPQNVYGAAKISARYLCQALCE